MKTCTSPVEIIKQGAQSLRVKMQNSKVEFEKKPQLFTACSRMQQDCPNSIKVRNTKLLPLVLTRAQKRISEQALH